MTTKNRRFLYIISALGLLICCAIPVAVFVGSRILTVLVHAAFPAPTIPPLGAATAQPTLPPSETPGPVTVCNGPEAMFILLIGTDSRADNYAAGLSDSMRVVRVDFVNPRIMYLSFQRDLYVEIPGIADHGITHGKLNQAYLYGNSGYGYYNGPGQGPGLLAMTLENNFGTDVDHYVAVNLQTFIRAVDAFGGIDISLPYVVDGRVPGSKDPNLYFPAGNQHLDGYRTSILARMRPEGDFQRSNTQNLILQALSTRLLSPDLLPALPGLIDAFRGSVQTDLGSEDIAQLLCLASMLDTQKVVAVNFPENLFSGTRVNDPVLGRTFVWDVDFNVLRSYVEYFNRGAWPDTPLQSP